jgi:serine protease Do
MRVFYRIFPFLAAFAAILFYPAPAHAAEKLNFERKNEVVKVVEVVKNSVVNISTERLARASSQWDEMFPSHDFSETAKTYSLGSGVIIDEDGYILTNAHVVKRANRIVIKLADKKEYDATVISVQASSDLALLRIKPDGKLSAIRVGTSKDIMIGETALALGNPFGLSNTVTVGVVSATDRSIQIGEKVVFKDFIQTDAAINPGNSGGPLVNINGELIGINIAIRAGGTGIGFAIPVDRVRETVRDLVSPGKVADISLGFTLREVQDNGLSVETVAPSGPADNASIKSGDIIVSVEGERCADFLDLAKHVIDKKAGETLKMTLKRADAEISVTLVLGAMPETKGQELARTRLGITVRRIPGFKAKPKSGDFGSAIVTDAVRKDGPADRVGVKKGDVIAALEIIEGRGNYWITYLLREVHEYADIEEFLAKAPKGQTVRITVLRNGEELQGRMVSD